MPGLPTQTHYRFLGTSATTKPTAAADGAPLPGGSTFDEQDTGVRWVWSDADQVWASQGYQPGLPDLVQAVKDSLARLEAAEGLVLGELQAIRRLAGLQAGVTVPSEYDPS